MFWQIHICTAAVINIVCKSIGVFLLLSSRYWNFFAVYRSNERKFTQQKRVALFVALLYTITIPKSFYEFSFSFLARLAFKPTRWRGTLPFQRTFFFLFFWILVISAIVTRTNVLYLEIVTHTTHTPSTHRIHLQNIYIYIYNLIPLYTAYALHS